MELFTLKASTVTQVADSGPVPRGMTLALERTSMIRGSEPEKHRAPAGQGQQGSLG